MLSRVLFSLTLGWVVLVFLYAPANQGREEFLSLLVQEHQQVKQIWGDEHSERVLDRTRWLLGEALRNRLPGELGKPMDGGGNDSVAVAGGRGADVEAMARIMRSAYPQAVEALLALSLYRVAQFVQIVPLLLPFVLAALADGIAERARRLKEFLPHSPATYGMFLWGVLCTVCALLVVFCYPGSVQPLVPAYALVALALCASGAVSRFVKQG
jgi:hypothetical protein